MLIFSRFHELCDTCLFKYEICIVFQYNVTGLRSELKTKQSFYLYVLQ